MKATSVPPEEQRSASPRGLAQLARAGFALVRKPITRIGYEVHHVADRPGYLHDVLNDHQEDPSRRFVETLTSSAYGTGIVVGVRTGLDVDGRALVGDADRVEVSGPPDTRVFSGSAVPNVSFVYDPTHVFECLIAVGDATSPLTLEHGRAIRDAVEHVATLAADEAHAPIISLQSPVQLPHPTRPGDWPRSSAVAVRFAIAVRRPNADLRLRLLDVASAFCEERGFGLWVKDLRSAFRAGNWFSICPHQPATVADYYGASSPQPQAIWSLPVTLVGPARVGAMQATMAYLTSHTAVHVFACSQSIVEDVAFIHLQLGSDALPADKVDRVNAEVDRLVGIADGAAAETALTRLLPELVGLLAADPGGTFIDGGLPAPVVRRVSDFQLLAGPARVMQLTLGESRRALWFSWEVEGQEDELRLPIVALYRVMSQLSARWSRDDPRQGQPNMEYLICRRVRHGTLRGKGKFSLPDTARGAIDGDLAIELSRLCERIEAMWKAELRPAGQGDRPARELTVAWRENWLGHWNQRME